MFRWQRVAVVMLAAGLLGLIGQPILAAGGGGGRGGRGGGEGGARGGFDMAQIQERMAQQMRERLGITSDDEWAVLQPRIQKVQTARAEAQLGGMAGLIGAFGGGRGRGGDFAAGGGRGGALAAVTQSPLAQAMAELRTALNDPNTPPDQIAAKLKAVRDARAKAEANLTAAENELKELLTQRQEANAVILGLLR